MFVLTVHSNPVPLSLRWEGTPNGPPVVSQGPTPECRALRKEIGPHLTVSCQLPCLASRGRFFFKSPGDSAVGGLSTASKVGPLSYLLVYFLSCFILRRKSRETIFLPDTFPPT